MRSGSSLEHKARSPYDPKFIVSRNSPRIQRSQPDFYEKVPPMYPGYFVTYVPELDRTQKDSLFELRANELCASYYRLDLDLKTVLFLGLIPRKSPTKPTATTAKSSQSPAPETLLQYHPRSPQSHPTTPPNGQKPVCGTSDQSAGPAEASTHQKIETK